MPSGTLGSTVGWLTLGALTTQSLTATGLNPYLAGYPADKPFGTQWAGTKPGLYSVGTNYFWHLIDTYSGQIGAAVRRGADNLVVGVHTCGYAAVNEAVRVTELFIATAMNMCSGMGCSFSYYIEPTATATPSRTATPTATQTRTATPTSTPRPTPVWSSWLYLPLVLRD